MLSLGGNLNYSDFAFRKVGSDLVLDTGASESLTFKSWYTGTTNKSVLTLQVVADIHKSMPVFKGVLPDDVDIAHKTGSVSNARTDAGILYLPSGPVVVCVLTDENEDKTWRADNAGNKLCADVAKQVHEHFNATKNQVKPPER